MDDTLLADGLEDAFIGFFQRINEPRIVVYDYEKCIQILMDRDGVVGPTLPPQVRLAMFNAGQPDHKKVTLTGSGMSMTRQMDKWDAAGVPYGGGNGNGFVNPVC